MISLDEYINENNDKIEAVINIYENQSIRYTEKIFSDLCFIAYSIDSKMVIFESNMIEFLFIQIAKRHTKDLFTFFQNNTDKLIFFDMSIRISNRSALLDITDEALKDYTNLNIFLSQKYLYSIANVSKEIVLNVYKQLLLSFVKSQWFDWYFEDFDNNFKYFNKNLNCKDYFVSIFIRDYLPDSINLLKYIDDFSILTNVFNRDLTEYKPTDINDTTQWNRFIDIAKSFLLMKEVVEK